MVTQDWGKAGDYTGILGPRRSSISPLAPRPKLFSVTADDNVIDYLVLERDGGN